MTGGSAAADTGIIGLRCNLFDKLGILIIRFVAVDINQPVIFLCQLESFPDRLFAELSGKLKVRDAADNITAHLQCFFYKLITVFIGVISFLWKSNQLNLNNILQLFLNFKQSTKRCKIRVRHIDMRTDKLDAVPHFHFDSLIGLLLDIFYGQLLLGIRPLVDRSKESSRFHRRVHGVNIVKMYVRLYIRSHDQSSVQIFYFSLLR